MTYLFIDESGDLGFVRGSSKWFVFTLVITGNKRPLQKVMIKEHRGLRKRFRNITELHAYHATPITRKRVLRGVAGIDNLQVLCVILNKQKVYTDLRSQQHMLYNYTANILLDRLHNKQVLSDDARLDVCIDRKDTKKALRDNFTWNNQCTHVGQEISRYRSVHHTKKKRYRRLILYRGRFSVNTNGATMSITR